MQDGKFHPHTDYKKGVRKLRDQKAKQKGIRLERIFQDDPDAVQKLEVKLTRLEKEKAYWKGLKPLPRTYQANEPDGAKRSFMLPNLNANIRTVRQKIELIESRQEKNIGLERKTTFKDGRKVFYYQEVKPNEERKARDPHFKSEGEWDFLFEKATVKKYNSGVATVNGASVHPNFAKSGSIRGMRDKYYGNDARLEPAGNFIYNVSSLVYHKDNPDEMMALKLDQFKDEQARRDLASVGLFF